MNVAAVPTRLFRLHPRVNHGPSLHLASHSRHTSVWEIWRCQVRIALIGHGCPIARQAPSARDESGSRSSCRQGQSLTWRDPWRLLLPWPIPILGAVLCILPSLLASACISSSSSASFSRCRPVAQARGPWLCCRSKKWPRRDACVFCVHETTRLPETKDCLPSDR